MMLIVSRERLRRHDDAAKAAAEQRRSTAKATPTQRRGCVATLRVLTFTQIVTEFLKFSTMKRRL